MKILVTGGAGFIGSHLVDAYVRTGNSVVVIDNLSTGLKDNVNERAVFYQGDICDASFVQSIIEKEQPELVNHHAAHIHVGRSVQDPLFDATVNIDGTINIMQSLKQIGSCKKMIFASTGGAMYGHKQTPFTEDMMPAPVSPYGVSKRAAELYLGFYETQYGIPFVVLRYANVYGPRQNPHGEAGVVSIFSKSILEDKQPIINGDGKQTRDYVCVDDVVRANLLATEKNVSGMFNIGTSIETDVNEIFRMVNNAFGASWQDKHGPERPGEQHTSSLSFEKAKKVLGWEPTVGIQEGIQRTVSWFKEHPDRI